MNIVTLPLLFFAVLLIGISDAFSTNKNHRQQIMQLHHGCSAATATAATTTTLLMSEEDQQQEEEQETTTSSSEDSTDDEKEEEEEEEKKPEESPEVTDLKEKIAKLESTVAEKKSSLQYNLEQIEEYSKSGYARKVAEMENMKRVRSNIASTSQSSATAAVLRDFLPMYDTFNTLNEQYGDDEFGTKYSELNLQQTFTTLGVTPFNVVPGDKINNFRMKVLESETSTEQPKETILREVASGLELSGNVIRPASCISSNGAGEDKNEKKDDDETAADDSGSE